MGGEALGPAKILFPSIGECQDRKHADSKDKNTEPHSTWRSSPSCLDYSKQGNFKTFSFSTRIHTCLFYPKKENDKKGH